MMHALWAVMMLFGANETTIEIDRWQDSAPKQKLLPVQPVDYGKWESLGGAALSPNGQWLAYEVSRVDGSRELRLRMLATDSTNAIEQGSGARISADSAWLAYRISKSEAEREKLEKAKKPIRTSLGIRSLTTGDEETIDNVRSFAFSEDGRFLAMSRYPARGRESGGADLVVRDLQQGLDTNFGNVGSFSWSDQGAQLAMLIDAEGQAGNGVRVYDPSRGLLRTLDSAEADYRSLSWREDSFDLAVLRVHSDSEDEDEEGKDGKDGEGEDEEESDHSVLTWRGLDGDTPARRVFDPRKHDAFPADMRVVEFAGVRWAEDGSAVYFGIKAKESSDSDEDESESTPEAGDDDDKDGEAESDDKGESDGEADEDSGDDEDGEDAPEPEKKNGKQDKAAQSLRDSLKDPAGVEVWHARDIDILPRQKRIAGRERRKHFLAVWWLADDRFVPLGSELTETVDVVEGRPVAIGADNTPYEEEKRFGPTVFDVYRIDARSGERRRILERCKYRLGTSPDGRYLLYLKGGHYWVYDIDQDRHRSLTLGLDADFINDESVVLTDESPPYGPAGWSEDGRELYLYDRYDLWRMNPETGAGARLTSGAERKLRYRRLILDREEDEFIEPERPIYLSLYGDRNKMSGFARLTPGQSPEVLLWEDERIRRLTKAEDADVFAFTRERFDDSPDFFVTDGRFEKPRQISETNPFQAEHAWGRSELIDYENANGVPLQGALFYPANYEPGKKYPMVVYIYELRSQVLHGYSVPSERRPYNTSVFTSEGYFVFQPDIVYRPQNPGLSAVECVVPAVEKVIESGMVDRDRVGLVGHSWGAYQTAFIVTQTDLFAAGIAGAPLTNMMSMSMSIYWNSGQTDAWIFHESQGRMDRPFWQDVDTYIKNSPIFNLETLNTPLLIAFGDEDGAVDWHQGIEMYNAARLAEKQLVMLVYAGENHGLAKKPNQVDYHYRIREWFGHYLKGDDAPKWITEGQSFLDREKELKELSKKKKGR